METYEQIQMGLKEEAIKNDDWIGVRLGMRKRTRKEVLAEVRKYLGSPTLPEKQLTTDITDSEGVPGFIMELEKDVYKGKYTKIISGIN